MSDINLRFVMLKGLSKSKCTVTQVRPGHAVERVERRFLASTVTLA